MSGDHYLRSILSRESVGTALSSPADIVSGHIKPIVSRWAGQYLIDFKPSGSLAKGTANKSGTDVDFFLSMHPGTPGTLKELYDQLFLLLKENGLAARKQNVSIGTKIAGYDVDLVPGKLRTLYTTDHSLYRRKADTWTQTDISVHIARVAASPYRDEIRTLKLWRNQQDLDFPSFYLELTVMKALEGKIPGTLADNVWAVLGYLHDRFPNARVVDPANTNNIISDDLTASDKQTISMMAGESLKKKTWNEVVG